MSFLGRVWDGPANFFVWPTTPKGRKVRIRRLMGDNPGEDRDVCAAIVYARDALRGYSFTDEEKLDAARIQGRLRGGEITMPADRGK